MYYKDYGSPETTIALRLEDTRRRARVQAVLRQSGIEKGNWLPSKRCQLLGLLGRWLVAWGKSVEGYALARTPAQSREPADLGKWPSHQPEILRR